MDAIGTPLTELKGTDIRYKAYQQKLLDILEIEKKVEFGGGVKKQAKVKKAGKLIARERIDTLLDDNSPFIEIGKLAAWNMYKDYGGAASAGTVMGLGYVEGQLCMIVANDPSVKAGAWFPMTAKKNLRAQEIAMDNHLPIIYLVDSAGIFLPLQNELFPDRDHFGRIFRNNAIMSARGIPQISAIMGSCVAGGAYLPIMSDEALIVEGTGTVFLAGSHLVKAAIGEEIDNQDLGGATVHCEISGVTDYKMPDDISALAKIRSLIKGMKVKKYAHFQRTESVKPAFAISELYSIIPEEPSKAYDVREFIARITDNSEWDEYKAGYGQTILCGYARIDGWSVGIVANQRMIVRNTAGEVQIGGVIYGDAADKAARFILNCNQRHIPLVFLQDVTGFMVGKKSEHSGILKDGAKLVNAVANSTVPKFTFVIGNSYGAGNYAMCGRSYDPRLMFSLPNSQIAVMGPQQAANTLLGIEIGRLKQKGEDITPEREAELRHTIESKYNEELDPTYAAARLWVDGIIDPVMIPQIVSIGIEAANHVPAIDRFNVGVIQT
jgi:3-methylcrotonyl-CoA carboxylase beta subunit